MARRSRVGVGTRGRQRTKNGITIYQFPKNLSQVCNFLLYTLLWTKSRCLQSASLKFCVNVFHLWSKMKVYAQRAFQRWINVESTSDLNVETTLKYGWIWKLDGRWNDDVESTSITWRWFNVGASTLNQRWLSDVESTSYYLYPTFNPNHNTTFICNTDAVENEI